MDIMFSFIPLLMIFAMVFLVPILIGVYVYRDASERGMNALLWTVVAMFVPSLVGVIIYLIVRENYSALSCRSCGEHVDRSFSTCPSCGAALKEKCPSCGAAVEDHYNVCPSCAEQLSQYNRSAYTGTSGSVGRKNNGFLMFLLAVVVLFPLLLLILGSFFFISGRYFQPLF